MRQVYLLMAIAFPYRLDIEEVQDGDRTLELQLHTLMPKRASLLANCQSAAQDSLAWFNDRFQIVDMTVPRMISQTCDLSCYVFLFCVERKRKYNCNVDA